MDPGRERICNTVQFPVADGLSIEKDRGGIRNGLSLLAEKVNHSLTQVHFLRIVIEAVQLLQAGAVD